MVFARSKMVIEDNCFLGEPGEVEINYVGPTSPQKMYRSVYDLILTVFNVPQSQVQEVRTQWGKGKEKEKVAARWWIYKDMDVFTYIYVRVDLSVEGSEKTGKAAIKIKSYLKTEYPQDTIWQRSIIYEMLRTFWHRVFYRRKREEYAEECRHLVIYFEKRVKEFLIKLREGKV